MFNVLLLTDMPVDIEGLKDEMSDHKESASNGDSSLPPTPPVSPPAEQLPPVVTPQLPAPSLGVIKNVIKPFEADLTSSVLEFPGILLLPNGLHVSATH